MDIPVTREDYEVLQFRLRRLIGNPEARAAACRVHFDSVIADTADGKTMLRRTMQPQCPPAYERGSAFADRILGQG